MVGEPRSEKQRRELLVRSLRAEGKSRVEVAEALRQCFRVNARVALRYARGWSQRQAADEWNRRWSDEWKTFKSFSCWEQWPSRTGNAPSFDNLAKLAELYECSVSDLLADLPNFRHLDTAAKVQETALALRKPDAGLVVPSDSAVWATATGLALPDTFIALLMQYLESLAPADRGVRITPRERDRAYHRLVDFLRSWAHTMYRRHTLRLLSWAASAAGLPAIIDGDEQERIAAVLTKPSRLDARTIGHIEAVLWHCRRQDHALGPQAVLTTVLAQRDLARALVPDCPADLRPRLLSTLSEASRLAGWLSFDLNRFDDAGYYYEDARALAHQAENAGLGGLVLCEMSHLATWQGKSRTGIDYAVAAGQWADRTNDMRLRAYTADVAGRAYAADGQKDACLSALDTAHTVLLRADDQAPSYSTYDEAVHISIRGECHLKLGEADRAISYAQQSLKVLDRSRARTVGMTIVDLGEAYVQRNEIDEAARLLGDAGDIAASHSSVRLAARLEKARAGLQPWQHTAAVRALDDRLASYGLT
jgi:tetratricopeptide (TPR) repeat protein